MDVKILSVVHALYVGFSARMRPPHSVGCVPALASRIEFPTYLVHNLSAGTCGAGDLMCENCRVGGGADHSKRAVARRLVSDLVAIGRPD